VSKESGLGNALYVGGFDLSGETKTWDVSGGPAMIDQTTIRLSAMARIGGLLSGKVSYTTVFDPLAATHLHLSTLPRASEVLMLAWRETLGAPVACCQTKQIGYDPTRAESGDVTFKVEAESDTTGVDWAVLATPGLRTDVAATNGASIDHGSVPAGSWGLQAYLNLTAFTGTNITIKLQGSSDDGAGDAFADIAGGSFGAFTAVGSAKLATSRTLAVERYLRVATTGTFTSATFAVGVSINDTAVTV
jgi:hypothetical protein